MTSNSTCQYPLEKCSCTANDEDVRYCVGCGHFQMHGEECEKCGGRGGWVYDDF